MRTALLVLRRLVQLTLVLFALTGVAGSWLWFRQGWLDPTPLPAVTVHLDPHGIPTVVGPDWPALVEAEGYVHASERLFQMDLARRVALGRLAEWFGEPALALDVGHREEDWPGWTAAWAAGLPPEERAVCDAYARGVNRFIDTHRWTWGLEYLLLRVRPEPWTCAHTGAVVLQMTADLSTSHPTEVAQTAWRRALPPDWAAFLLPDDHPWNVPLVGEPRALALPQVLPEVPSNGAGPGAPSATSPPEPGSNAWAWRDSRGAWLANDPHLGQTVPGTWYLIRLRVNQDDWIVGASLPGVPGVLLGMNPHLAWGFTNVAEDVDDLLLEAVSPDGDRYLELAAEDGPAIWAPVVRRAHTIEVRGGGPVSVDVRLTRRGPLARRPLLDGAWASRQWLPLVSPEYRLPVLAINLAKSWEELNDALDGFRYPAQAVLVADRDGGIGWRVSGTGPVRQATGRSLQPAVRGEWVGLRPPGERPRLWLPADPEQASPRYLVTANQRQFTDQVVAGYGQGWSADDRADRIRTALDQAASAGHTLTVADHEALQRDTTSRFDAALLAWLATHATVLEPATGARWQAWDGSVATDARAFDEARQAEARLLGLLVERAARHLFTEEGLERLGLPLEVPRYEHRLARAWLVTVLEVPEAVAVFGLTAAQVADAVVRELEVPAEPWPLRNAWATQHPFVGRIPTVGELWRVPGPAQPGSSGVPRVEGPRFGASVRLVWDLADPTRSTWILPVGQSGHRRSPHWRDQQDLWHAGGTLPVLDPAFAW